MLLPVILAIIGAVFYAATNHIDKFLISKAVKNADFRALILSSSFIAGGLMLIVYAFVCGFDVAFDFQSIAILFANSVIYIVSTILYLKALNRDDTTIVIIMFSFVPVLLALLSPLFLPDQGITLVQLIGDIVITFAAVFVAYESDKKRFSKKKLVTLAMMTVTSVGYAMWYILERFVNLDHDFNKTTFWSNVTLCLAGVLIYIFFRSFRKSFKAMLKTNGKKVLVLNMINEILNSFGGIITTFAGTLASVSLVSFTSQGVQPFAVMIIGIILAKIFPKIEKENITKKETIKRIIAIVFCVIGLACIEFG